MQHVAAHDESDRPQLITALIDAYQGEIFGVAMYERLAGQLSDPWQRWQWECLAQLEREVRDDLAVLLDRLGCRVGADPAEVVAGVAEADRILCDDWPKMLDAFIADVPPLIDRYAAILDFSDVEANLHDAHAVVERLVEHEVAAVAFHRGEMAGASPEESICEVVGLLRGPLPAPPRHSSTQASRDLTTQQIVN